MHHAISFQGETAPVEEAVSALKTDRMRRSKLAPRRVYSVSITGKTCPTSVFTSRLTVRYMWIRHGILAHVMSEDESKVHS